VRSVGSHRGGESEVLSRGGVVPAPGQGEPEPEVRVVVARAGLHDHAEVVRRLRVPPGVELSAGEGLEHAARLGLGSRRALQHLGEAAGVERVVFDRAGFHYHGRVRSLAEAAREAGLDF